MSSDVELNPDPLIDKDEILHEIRTSKGVVLQEIKSVKEDIGSIKQEVAGIKSEQKKLKSDVLDLGHR